MTRQAGGALRYRPGSVSKERGGNEGLRGRDMTRFAFQEVLLAAAWRTDGRRARAGKGRPINPPG